jgi:hypothetical protein
MSRSIHLWLLAALVAVFPGLGSGGPDYGFARPDPLHSADARFAGPIVMVFTGGPLGARRVILHDQTENVKILSDHTPVSIYGVGLQALASRPHIDIGFFWTARSTPPDTSAMKNLQLTNAEQCGRFYPARGPDRAILYMCRAGATPESYRIPGPIALGILQRKHVITSVP